MKTTLLSRIILPRLDRRKSALALVAVLVSLVVAPAASFAQGTSSDPAIATQMLKLINDWRVQQNLWPLRVNKTLEDMAITQATYIAPGVDAINDEAEYHKDAKGRTPLQRASVAPYNWPTYGSPTRIEIGENAGVGSVQFALNFWKSSDIHRRAALSNVYREVGIAAVPHRGPGGGYVFIVDFGAQPGVLPALLDPSLETLYVTTENSRYASVPASSMKIRVLGADGSTIRDSGPWQPKVTIPKSVGGQVTVEYTNGTQKATWKVDPAVDVAILPGTKVVASNPTGTPVTTQMPATPTVTATESATKPAPTKSATATPTATQAATEIPATATATPVPQNGPITLVLTYNAKSLFVYNSSGAPLDLRPFGIGSDVGKIAIGSWSKIAQFPTAAFPAGHCLEADENGTEGSAPSNCKFVRSIILMPAPRVFWSKETFSVFKGRDVVATCSADAGRCEVAWN